MRAFKNYTLKEYLNILSQKTPVPGGGSVAALTASLGCGLMSMVINYSLGKGLTSKVEARLKAILIQNERLRLQLLKLVDLDAQAYLEVVNARKKGEKQKLKAQKKSQAVPLEICRLCYKAVNLAPYVVEHGNKNLLSDLHISVELLAAAFKGAFILTKT